MKLCFRRDREIDSIYGVALYHPSVKRPPIIPLCEDCAGAFLSFVTKDISQKATLLCAAMRLAEAYSATDKATLDESRN